MVRSPFKTENRIRKDGAGFPDLGSKRNREVKFGRVEMKTGREEDRMNLNPRASMNAT